MSLKSKLSGIALSALIAASFVPTDAFARDRGDDNNRGRGNYSRNDDRRDNGNRGNDRHEYRRGNVRIIDDYHNNIGKPHRTRNGTIIYSNQRPIIYRNAPTVHYVQPYGYYKQRPYYYVGQRFSHYDAVPYATTYRLGPPPRGYYYGAHQGNIFLVQQQDNSIAQIISLLLGY